MKRSGPPRRKKGLRRDTPKAREFADSRSELRPKVEKVREFLRRGQRSGAQSLDASRRKRKPRPTEGPLSPEEWWLDAYRSSGGWCIITRTRADGPEDPRFHAHHAIEKRLLRDRGLHAYVWDPRNSMWIAALVHGRHTSGFRRIGRLWLPPSVWEFAEEMDRLSGTQWATERLRRDYPMKEE